MTYYTLVDAWQAYQEKRYDQATEIFKALIAQSRDQSSRHEHQLGYAYVLIAQRDFAAARELLNILNQEQPQTPAYLHQLALLESELGQWTSAGDYLSQELDCIESTDALALAQNHYWQGWAAYQQQDYALAQAQADESLAAAQSANSQTAIGEAWRLAGDIALITGQKEAARMAYDSAQAAFSEDHNLEAIETIKIRLEKLSA